MDKWVNLWTNITFDLRSTLFVAPLQGGPRRLSPDPTVSAKQRLHQAYIQQIFSLLVFSLGANSCAISQENSGDQYAQSRPRHTPCDLILNPILNLPVRNAEALMI